MRRYSVVERLGLFGLAVGGAAAVWPTVAGATGAGLPCPLRSLTGVPCPGCGLTSAAVALVRGDIAGAFVANPAILGLAALTVGVLPVLALRAIGALAEPVAWSPQARQRTGWLMVVLAAASWVFQLNRLSAG